MDVSIIIVNYKTPQLCVDCIQSVIDKTVGINYEIIVVDNASGDNSIELLKEKFGNKMTFVSSGKNLGFGKANNLGARCASGDYLFLLNSDTILRNNAIKILYDFISANQNVGIVGGNLFNADGSPAHSYKREKFDLDSLKVFNFFKSLRHKITKTILQDEFNTTGKPLKIEGYITGADLMIRRELFNQIGGFDKDFFMYFEENELTCRVQNLGYDVYSVPSAEITHLEGASTGKASFSGKRLRMYNESAVKFFEKVYGKESVEDCYNILISNCRKVKFRKLLQFDFDAAKKLKEEKNILEKAKINTK